MKRSEAIGKKVYFRNKNDITTIKEIRKLENYDKSEKDMFLCYLENGALVNCDILYLVEGTIPLIIED